MVGGILGNKNCQQEFHSRGASCKVSCRQSIELKEDFRMAQTSCRPHAGAGAWALRYRKLLYDRAGTFPNAPKQHLTNPSFFERTGP
jgi:hypothetical protein